MSEKNFRGESFTPDQRIERDFGVGVARAVERLRKTAQDKNFESLMQTLRRMLASENIDISDEQFESLERTLSENKKELGFDSESK